VEAEVSLPNLQQPAIYPYPEPAQSSIRPPPSHFTDEKSIQNFIRELPGRRQLVKRRHGWGITLKLMWREGVDCSKVAQGKVN
jgi:hypothetical protein